MTGKDGAMSGWAVGDRAFWTPTRITAVTIFLVGLVGAVLVVATRGFTAASQAQLVTLAALILVGAGAFAAPGSGDSGDARTLQLILWMVAALVFANVALAWIDLDRWAWRAPMYFPFTEPIGADFRIGGYVPAEQFSNAATVWPPFTIVLSTPYLLLEPNTAYVVHVCILVALNIAALAIAVAVLHSRDGDDLPLCGPAGVQVGLLAPAFSVWLFVSYGFLLSVERGNFDAFVAFFAMLGLWSMVRRPSGVWLATIAFSVAAEIKVYPALLLLLVIWRFRWKSILPLLACNAVLALSAGPRNLVNYFHSMTRATNMESAWVGNSSAKSFSTWVDWLDPRYLPHLPVALLIAIPVVLFVFTAWRLWRRHDHAGTALMLCGMVPVMCAVPSISHDYKVVLFGGPAVLLVGLLMRHIGRGSAEPWWMLLALTLALFFVARAPGQLVDYTVNVQRFVWPAVLMNKYPPILLFQIVVAWMAWRLPAPVVLDAASQTLPTERTERTVAPASESVLPPPPASSSMDGRLCADKPRMSRREVRQ